MKFVNCSYDKVDNEVSKAIENGLTEDCAILSSKPDNIILVSLKKNSHISENDLLNTNHILLKQNRVGGTLVTFKDGITIWMVTKSCATPFHFVNAVCKFLKNKNLDAVIDNNDILVDGYKVSGNFSQYIGPKRDTLFGIHISLNVDLDVIKHYCDKEMNKIPKGLSEYGITRDELLDVFYKFVDEQNKLSQKGN